MTYWPRPWPKPLQSCNSLSGKLMETLTTKGIKVSVESFYQETQSRPLDRKYVFAYRITIENGSRYTVQLLRRHWHIVDSNDQRREVEGEGVIGQQPVLAPGESHQYVSWCPLTSEIGKMYGTYLMVRPEDQRTFDVRIPEFKLIAPFKLN